MLNKYLAMGLGALIALAPLVVLPQAAQAATEKAMTHSMKGIPWAHAPRPHVLGAREGFG